MADRLTDFATKSLVHHIETQVSVDNAYIITPDFDWDRKPDPADPGNSTLARAVPYAAVQVIEDLEAPFTVSANILYESTITLEVNVCADTYTQCVRYTSDIKQALRTASSVISGVGITLYDFDTPEGEFYSQAGTLQVDLQGTDFPSPETQQREGNFKYRSITPITLTAFRDATATLLENKGRINTNEQLVVASGVVESEPDFTPPDPEPTPDPLLLDTYSDAAAAYSVRKVRSGYSGPCIRIREDIGETETDIGFDSNGKLDTAAISAHCGDSADGYVVKWYDQSGNDNHVQQTVANSQPKIFEGSTSTLLTTINGDAAIQFAEGLNAFLTTDVFSTSRTVSFSAVYRNFHKGERNQLFRNGSAAGQAWGVEINASGKPTVTISGSANLESAYGAFDNTQSSIFGVLVHSDPSITMRVNGYSFLSNDLSSTATPSGDFIVGSSVIGLQNLNGELQELIIWDSDRTSDQSGIESNVISRYKIDYRLFDFESASAAGGYSLKKLSREYDGFCLQIREDGGDTLANIGFDVYGDVDVAAIASHCGSNNGRVVRWYDQSGNAKHATQETLSDQPLLYDGSSVLKENGNYTMQFLEDGYFECISNPLEGNIGATIFFVGSVTYQNAAVNANGALTVNYNTNITGEGFTWQAREQRLYSHNNRTSFNFGYTGSAAEQRTWYDFDRDGRSHFTAFYITAGTDLDGMRCTRNGKPTAASDGLYTGLPSYSDPSYQANVTFPADGTTYIGARERGLYPFRGNIQQVVFFSKEKFDDRSVLEGEVLARYKSDTQEFCDLHSRDVEAIYSIRKRTQWYNGPCMRIREGAGDTEVDIYFKDFDNGTKVDSEAIALFCGSATGYVVTWYDQSGNGRHATQSDTSLQPTIYDGSNIEKNFYLEMGVQWAPGSNNWLETASNFTVSNPCIYMKVSHDTSSGQQQYIVDSKDHNLYYLHNSSNQYQMYAGANLTYSNLYGSYTPIRDYPSSHLLLYNGANSRLYAQDSSRSTGNAGSNPLSGLRLGNYAFTTSSDPTYSWDGIIHDVVIWAGLNNYDNFNARTAYVYRMAQRTNELGYFAEET